MIACQYCGRNVADDLHMQQHMRHCTRHPDIAPHVLACLVDEARPGYAVPYERYNMRCVGTPAPAAHVAAKAHGGYENFCAAFGLQSPKVRGATSMQPSYDEARRLADELHDGEYAPTGREYDRHASGEGVLTFHHILRVFGSWVVFCAAANLVVGTREDYARRKQERRGSKRLSKLDAPLTDAERHACKRRGMVEDAATGNVHCPLRSVVL